MQKITTLFLTFFKIGTFTFGGGYAMIALLKNEFVTKKHWITNDMFVDMIAIAESTPGPAAINSATYIGYQTAGFRGALAATTAVCIPSFTMIYLISLFFDRFLKISIVNYAFDGIQVCVIYLILSAAIQMLHEIRKTLFNMTILITAATTMLLFSILSVHFSTVLYILIYGVIGIFVYTFKLLSHQKGTPK